MLDRLFALFGYRIFRHKTLGFRLLPLDEKAQKGTLQRPAPVDVRELGNDPRILGYHDRPVLVHALLAHGRNSACVPMDDPNGLNPFVQAARLAAQGRPLTEVRDNLLEHHDNTAEESLLARLGLTAEQAPGLVEFDRDPFALSMRPWDSRSAEHFRAKALKRKAKRKRFEKGETPEQWAMRHAKRLNTLTDSVMRNGLLRNDGPSGDIEATALVNPAGLWRWQTIKGHHRAAVLSALEYREVPVRITRLVREDEVNLWPNVANGLFSEGAAARVFRRHFDGAPQARAETGAATD